MTNQEFTLSAAERERYSRHLLLPSLGVAGVTKLRSATVVVVGAGGIAQTLLTYLTTSGVGTIIIIDFDHIEPSNLARQFLFTSEDIGKPKAEVTAKKLSALNPGVKIIPLVERVTQENFIPILATFSTLTNCTSPTSHTSHTSTSNSSEEAENVDYPIFVETVDSIKNKLLLHDLALEHGITLVHGAALAEEGEILTIMPKMTKSDKAKSSPHTYLHTCLYCYFPNLGTAPPPAENIPLDNIPNFGERTDTDSCATEGVLAPVCGLIGSLQAVETIRVLTNPEKALTNQLLHIHLPSYRFRLLSPRVSNCPRCGFRKSHG